MMIEENKLLEFAAFARELCLESKEGILRWFRAEDLNVESKVDDSPVTRADRETETLFRERIATAYPSHGIIGEEFGNEREDAEIVWVLDPIDGTISFVHGVPLFGTLLGLLHRGEPLLGVIHHPALDLLLIGNRSLGTTCNGKPVRLRDAPSTLEEATLLTSDVSNVANHAKLDPFLELTKRVKVQRTWGDCYGYSLVATGYADIMVDPIMNSWDILPVIPVIEGAGGKITSWDGSPAKTGRSAIAAHPEIHDHVVRALN